MSASENVYATMLRERLKTPIKTTAQAHLLLGDIGLLVVDLSDKVYRLDEKVYGNGKVGMAMQVTGLTGRVDEIHELVTKMSPVVEKVKLRATDRDAPKDSDWFRIVVRYFVDKILPALLISAIVGWLTFQFALLVFLEQNP